MLQLWALLSLVTAASAVDDPEAPAEFSVFCTTSKGDDGFKIDVHRSWSPKGVDRFHALVQSGFYDDAPFFRMVKGFVVQFGLASDPAKNTQWKDATFPDDTVTQSNERGTLSFAMRGKDTRTTQLFINLGNNARLDGMGFSAFGKIDEAGMKHIDALNYEYGEQPDQGRLTSQGANYWRQAYPALDFVKKCIVSL